MGPLLYFSFYGAVMPDILGTFPRHSPDIPRTSPDIPAHPRTSPDIPDIPGSCPGMSGDVRGCPGMSGECPGNVRDFRGAEAESTQVLVRPSRFWPPWSRRRRELRGTAGRARGGGAGPHGLCGVQHDQGPGPAGHPRQAVALSLGFAGPAPGARRLWQPWAPRSLWLFSKGLGKLELQSGGPRKKSGVCSSTPS